MFVLRALNRTVLKIELTEFNTNDEDFIPEYPDENLQNFDIDELYEIP